MTNRQTSTLTDKYAVRQTDRQADGQTDSWTVRQMDTDRQGGRRADRQTHTYTGPLNRKLLL